MITINTHDYWDNRFKTDWREMSGPEQSEMFANVACGMLPEWLVSDIKTQKLSVLDVGCAEGDALPVLSRKLGPSIRVAGLDFAEAAVHAAKSKYPDFEFFVGEASSLPEKFGVIFCSNVLEHFSNPLELLTSLACSAQQHVVILVPFWEFPRHEEHFVTFDASSFPVTLPGDMLLSHWDVRDTRHLPETRWAGYQGMVVYSKREAVGRCDMRLDRILASSYLPSLGRDELAEAAKHDPALQRLANLSGKESARLDSLHSSVGELASRQESIGYSLHEHIEAAQRELAAMLAPAIEKNQSLNAMIGELSERRANYDAFNQQLKSMLDAVGSLAEGVRERSDRSADLSEKLLSTLEKMYENDIASVEIERDKFRAAHDSLLAQSDQIRSRNAALEADTAVATARVGELEASLHALQVAREATESRYQEVLRSRSWRITAPLRKAMRLLQSRRGDSAHPSSPLKRLAEASVTATRVDYSSQLAEILAQNAGKTIIVFPPLVDWDLPLFQRPHHIAARLARQGFLYFYCTPNAYDGIEGFKKLEDGLYLTNQFELVSGLYANKIIHLYSTDNHRTLAYVRSQQQNLAKIVYEYIDEIDATISGADIQSHVWEKHHALLADPSVICIASADKLYAEVESHRTENIALVTNGVEFEHFSDLDRNDAPSDIADWVIAGKPIVGYFGALATWFDYSLVEQCAERYPHLNFLLLGWDYDGSLSQSRLKSYDNVRVVGPIPYRNLPRYARFFDVSTIPFKINAVTESTSPIKLFEYMSMGRPIITTDMPECRKYKSVLIGKNQAEYIDLIAVALSKVKDDAYLVTMRNEALENTWDSKAKTISDLIG